MPNAKADETAAALMGFIIGVVLTGFFVTMVYVHCRPFVTKWRKLPNAPAVEVPAEIKWKGALYDCVLKESEDK